MCIQSSSPPQALFLPLRVIFLYVTIFASTQSIVASTLKSPRPSTIMRSRFLLSMILLSAAALATLHEQEDTQSGVLTSHFLKSLSCSYQHILIDDANHRESNQTAWGRQGHLSLPCSRIPTKAPAFLVDTQRQIIGLFPTLLLR